MAPVGLPEHKVSLHWSHLPVFSPREHKRGNRKTHVLALPNVAQMDRVVGDYTIEMGGSLSSLFSPVSGARRAGRKMRPAGGNNRSPKKLVTNWS